MGPGMRLIIAGSRTVPMTLEGFRFVLDAVAEAGYISRLDADYTVYLEKELLALSGRSQDMPPPCGDGSVEAHIVDEVVSGGAIGVDQLGEDWATVNWLPVKLFPVTREEWRSLGKKAGILRNIKMGDYADALVAVWDGKSSGTKHIIDYMRKLGKPVYIKEWSDGS